MIVTFSALCFLAATFYVLRLTDVFVGTLERFFDFCQMKATYFAYFIDRDSKKLVKMQTRHC